ncbi:L-ribulokinase [Paenibacillus sp. UNCCL117]|uniref:ribulokinase n=1 Tax=unclassified Paenibacillus TaxID=185978 RepID=UPI00088A777E|nr:MULTISPECIES: ribulokinase [unclassified Paenibacillus]SDD57838.1 L-ribulokinase [Paenibacillus sp. cl123]SFW51114.1 L-ribulokinase [Paenibacillus sp. UNCCL117]
MIQHQRNRYVIGVDYGTESGRALLVNAADGEEIAAHVTPYAHGVISRKLPGTGISLPADWALQHPDDYLEVLRTSIPAVMRKAGVKPEEVIGLGVDFTACTMLPVTAEGVPLCKLEKFRDQPHSWVKLWKHHAAAPQAERVNAVARERGEVFLARYGGTISSEWLLPKVLETAEEAPAVFEEAAYFVEAADWIVWQLSGGLSRSSCCAGYKGIWHKTEGYPPDEFLKQLDPRLEGLYSTKLAGRVDAAGHRAGGLTPQLAADLGLAPGTAVATAIIDAHAAVLGCGVTKPGSMVLAMGTSLCHMALSDREELIPGVNGVVEDGIIPGLFGYEAGQPAVGDMFAWFVERIAVGEAGRQAEAEGISVHGWLEREAAKLLPGQSGLLALDWWNGGRSPILDERLSGLLVGLRLDTTQAEIYRALLEAAAFGTRRIIECFEEAGIAIDALYACGGLPPKNKLLMRIFSDVTGKPIKLAASSQPVALGAAICGAAAAGAEAGGYDSLPEAVTAMGRLREEELVPEERSRQAFDSLYTQYRLLHEAFGLGGGPLGGVMRTLKALSQAESGSLP